MLVRLCNRLYILLQPYIEERFYLQILLISISSLTSIKDLYTVASIVYLTFQTAYIALELLEDNYKQINYLIEACIVTASAQLLFLFITALLYSPIAEPVILQDCFKRFIYNNLPHFLACQPNTPPTVTKDDNTYFNYSLYLIYQILADY